MKKLLALAFGGVLVALAAGCGGSGSGPGPIVSPPPPPPSQYVGVANARGLECSFLVGAVSPGHTSRSSAQTAVRQSCDAEATRQAAGSARGACKTATHSGCASVVVGQSSTHCWSGSHGASSLSDARSSALQECRNLLGSGADCMELVSGCATSTVSSAETWRPTFGGGNGDGSGGVDRGQVGDEFGTTPTTGRTNLNLTCTDDVVFSNSGNVVLPSVDVVNLPSEAGTVTLDYDALDIPDRFVVQVGNQIAIDTQYVGTNHSVAEVNAVLARYGFTRTSQASIISPGDGSSSFQKAAGVTSAVVRVYAPLPRTAWHVTLKFAGSSCPGGPGGGTPPPPPPPQAFGAIAVSLEPQCQGSYGGAAIEDSRTSARSVALTNCRIAGGTRCRFAQDFGSAYIGNVDCGSVAYGTRPSPGGGISCNVFLGQGGSESQAESDALSDCRAEMTSCSILPSRRGGSRNFTNCAH